MGKEEQLSLYIFMYMQRHVSSSAQPPSANESIRMLLLAVRATSLLCRDAAILSLIVTAPPYLLLIFPLIDSFDHHRSGEKKQQQR